MIVFCHLLNDRSGSPTVLSSTLDALGAHDYRVTLCRLTGAGRA